MAADSTNENLTLYSGQLVNLFYVIVTRNRLFTTCTIVRTTAATIMCISYCCNNVQYVMIILNRAQIRHKSTDIYSMVAIVVLHFNF